MAIMDQCMHMISGRSLSKPVRKFRTSFGEEILLKDPYCVDDNGCLYKTPEKNRKERLCRRFTNPQIGRVAIYLRWWMPEIFASILSLTTLIALIIVVRAYDGRGLQHINLPSSLTLNGLIAVLSTINRVALMVPIGSAMSQEIWLWFSEYQRRSTCDARLQNLELLDSASRGAWGSLLLLLKAERRWLAYYGALVTIISLAFGTFTQQLLTFVTLPVTSDALKPGNIQHAETWYDYRGNPAENCEYHPVPMGQEKKDSTATTAISIPPSLKAAAYNGVLSSGQLPLTALCPTGNCTWPMTPSLAICGACSNSTYQISCPLNTTPTDGSCNYTMPSGSTAFLTSAIDGYDAYSFKSMSSNGSIYKKHDPSRLYFANFDIVNTRERPTQASECALWMCVQAYETKTLDLKQTQRTVQTFSTVIDSNLGTKPSGANLTFRNVPTTMNPVLFSRYTVVLEAQLALQTFFADFFNGNITYNLESSTQTSDIVEAISLAQNLNDWIENLALSLTNVVRSDIPASSDLYNGTAYQLGVRTRWAWIILPLALVLSSLVILVTAIIRTARSPVQAWKGSPLVMLFISVDEAIMMEGSGKVDTYSGLSDAVGGMRVRIKVDGEGNWGFEGTGIVDEGSL